MYIMCKAQNSLHRGNYHRTNTLCLVA